MPGDTSFRMTIVGVFTIKGRGSVITGRVEDGVINVGDDVYFKSPSGVKKTVVKGLEASQKLITQAQMGDTIGVLVEGVEREEIKRGDILSGTNSDYSWSS
jgi:elongation factor Tu